MKEFNVSEYNFYPELLKDISFPDKITIYDSTLRDGEQMPGISFDSDQKLIIAKKLDDMKIPEIEAGFPAVSKNELNTVKNIANEGLKAKILVLSRLKKEDIDAAIKSNADVVLLFIAASPIHIKHKLHLKKEEIKNKIVESIDYAKEHGITPSFSTEDSTRTPIEFLEELVELACNAGAKRIGFTDTLGCATPNTIKYLFSNMRKNISLPISAHLHNDFGLALINAITALGSGATHVCTTINGWGERAGNVSLEQLVMALKVLYNKDLGINTTSLKDLSETVSNMCKIPLPKTQPFVGDNIFTHESGIHVAAILENPYTYEPISPESVGNKRNLIIGKHSGKKMIKHFLEKNEIKIDDKNLLELVFEIKNFSETNGKISSEQILKFAKNRSKLP